MFMIYAIINLKAFANLMRHKAAIAISPDYTEELDDYISIDEVILLIKENCLGYDKNKNILINEERFDECVFQVEQWIYDIGLAKLAGKNLIECGWDSKKNKMVFWTKTKSKDK